MKIDPSKHDVNLHHDWMTAVNGLPRRGCLAFVEVGEAGPSVTLGRVDGFNQDEAECKGYEGSVVLRGLLASECDAFEALEFRSSKLM